MECLQCFCNFLCDFIVLLKENSEWLCAIALAVLPVCNIGLF